MSFGLTSISALEMAGGTPVTSAAQGLALDGVRVLVVDDSDINLEVARRLLLPAGAQVSVAAHGLEAVEYLRAHPAAVDVVLMDVQMPVLDGIEATRCIHGELGLTHLPVIALTAGVLADEQDRTREAGMVDFIRKPFDVAGLLCTVHYHARNA